MASKGAFWGFVTAGKNQGERVAVVGDRVLGGRDVPLEAVQRVKTQVGGTTDGLPTPVPIVGARDSLDAYNATTMRREQLDRINNTLASIERAREMLDPAYAREVTNRLRQAYREAALDGDASHWSGDASVRIGDQIREAMRVAAQQAKRELPRFEPPKPQRLTTGSPKQIQWAERIRAEQLSGLQRLFQRNLEHMVSTGVRQSLINEYAERVQRAAAQIASQTDARRIIDNRDRGAQTIIGEIVDQIVGRFETPLAGGGT